MGKLFDPLDVVLSSRSKVRLLRTLLASAQPMSGREAARRAGVARVAAARSLEDLVALGIVERGESSRQYSYRMNPDSQLVKRGLQPLYAAERERIEAVFDWVRDTLAAVPAEALVLGAWIFGSTARGDDTVDSDLDVLVAVADESSEHPVHTHLSASAAELQRRFGLRLSPVVLPRERLTEMDQHQFSLIDEVKRDGRPVMGEDFARFLR